MDLVADVCEIPARFKARGDVSVVSLVDESGYGDAPADLKVDAVAAYLAQHPALVDAWIGYSEDKRVSSGWYTVENSGWSISRHAGREYASRRGGPLPNMTLQRTPLRAIAERHDVAGTR